MRTNIQPWSRRNLVNRFPETVFNACSSRRKFQRSNAGVGRKRHTFVAEGLRGLDTQPALDGVIQVFDNLIQCLALCQTAGQGRHFRPVPAFFGGMNAGGQAIDLNADVVFL